MKTRPALSLVAAIATATTLALASGAAGASTVHRGRLMSTMTSHGLVTAPATIGTSTSNAGYLGLPATVTSVTADVIVPTVQCDPSVTNPSFINVFVNGTLPSTNISGSGLVVILSCFGLQPHYEVHAVIDNTSTPTVQIAAGDHVTITGTVTATSEHYTINDATKGIGHSFNGAGLANSDAQFTTQFGFGTQGGFPPFTNMAYFNLTVNGQTLGATNNNGFSQVDSVGNVMVQTTHLNAAGKAFALVYKTNQAVNPT
jgi:hypothetical protein